MRWIQWGGEFCEGVPNWGIVHAWTHWSVSSWICTWLAWRHSDRCWAEELFSRSVFDVGSDVCGDDTRDVDTGCFTMLEVIPLVWQAVIRYRLSRSHVESYHTRRTASVEYCTVFFRIFRAHGVSFFILTIRSFTGQLLSLPEIFHIASFWK